MAITIQEATADDYPRAQAVIAEIFAFHLQAMPAFFRSTATPPPSRQFVTDLLREGGAFLLAYDQEEVVGFLTLRIQQTADTPYLTPVCQAIVDSFGIHADRRRQGIGRGLLEYAQSWAKHQGATRLQLTVWEFNADAVAFYESLGYETYSRNLWKTL